MTALTVTVTPLINGPVHRQVHVTILAPTSPAQATNTAIYDPTTTPWTTSGAYVGTKIRAISVFSSIQGASGTQAALSLVWDANTPVVAFSIPCNSSAELRGLELLPAVVPNSGGTGVSGKIGFTSLGMVAGDTVTIILDIINS
jgi:hypothetical protein